jgi:hypothetical protein
MMPNVFSSQYLTLDIAEFRTPKNLVADALTLTAPTANAFYGSFATIPVKASSTFSGNINNNEFYNANYRIVQEFSSRIDKLDRLTVSWRQPNNGNLFIDTNFTPSIDLGRNMFLLRLETVLVPESPERPLSLPSPVSWDPTDHKKQLLIVTGIAFIGIVLIILSK